MKVEVVIDRGDGGGGGDRGGGGGTGPDGTVLATGHLRQDDQKFRASLGNFGGPVPNKK